MRNIWLCALFIFLGAFEIGRWTEAAEPWQSSRGFAGALGLLMLVVAALGLRATLRRVQSVEGGS
jgi:hypothetical protein